jgi:two-component system probable response regulator PhcQ
MTTADAKLKPKDTMQPFYDYQKFALLYVDDEEKSLKYFQRAFGGTFRVLTATSAAEGMRVLEAERGGVALILTDQRMPGETGVQFLEKTRQLHPRAIRILVTAFSDLNAAIDAVNTGAIYKYITKPWDVPMLEITLKRAIEFYIVQNDRDLLLREKLSALHKLVITDRVIGLGVLAAGLGHHIRNAFVAIRTFIDLAPEMLHREQADFEELRHPEFWTTFYSKVQQKVESVVQLLNGLDLASVSPERVREATVRLPELVADVWNDYRDRFAEAGLNAEFLIPSSLPELVVDERRFRQLIELLFREALINLSQGNRLSLEATQVTLPGGDEGIRLRVADDGPGLPADAVASLFDPFFLRVDEPQEFGINLMACYFIVYHHGGRIDVEQTPGRGLTLNLQLPLKPRPLEAENDSRQFLARIMMNDRLWEALLANH